MEKVKSKTKIKIYILITLLIIMLFFVTYGYFFSSSNQSDRNRLTGECFNTSFSDGNSINLVNAMPESFDDAIKNTPYEFTLSNTCNLSVKYYVLLNVKSGSFSPSFINYTFDEKGYTKLSDAATNDKYTVSSSYTSSHILKTGFLKQSDSITEKINLWIDENTSLSDIESGNNSFIAEIKIVTEVGDSAAVNTFNILKNLNTSLMINQTAPDLYKISPLPIEYQNNGFSDEEQNWSPSVNTNYITYGDGYTFNNSTGKYTLTNPQTCKWNDCYTNLTGKYYTSNTLYSNTDLHNESNQETLYQITSSSTSTTIYYHMASTTIINYKTSDTGIFKMNDNYGQSLYFRGNVENNYVKFGKNSNNQDMYWRIIRINGDGTLRMIYDGTSAHENDESSNDRIVGTSSFVSSNSSVYDVGYVGYMYGNFEHPSGCSCTSNDSQGNCIYTCANGGSTSYAEAHANIKDSDIKLYVENWYKNNILNSRFKKYIADEIFCNDRTIGTNNLGYGQNKTFFGFWNEDLSFTVPSLICTRKNDSFTMANGLYGNEMLKYPVGLITASESQIAGGKYGGSNHNYKYYLHKGSTYWSMTPGFMNMYGRVYIMEIRDKGYIHNIYPKEVRGIAPVINLKSEYLNNLIGDGTINNPFRFE